MKFIKILITILAASAVFARSTAFADDVQAVQADGKAGWATSEASDFASRYTSDAGAKADLSTPEPNKEALEGVREPASVIKTESNKSDDLFATLNQLTKTSFVAIGAYSLIMMAQCLTRLNTYLAYLNKRIKDASDPSEK